MMMLTLACFSVTAKSSDTTSVNKLFGTNFGAFGGFGFSYTEPASKETLGVNVQGGIIYDHWLSGGIYANAFFSLNPIKDRLTGNDANLLGGYGGLFVSPSLYPNSLIHINIPIFVGYGGINYELFDAEDYTSQIEDSDRYWVFEPGIEIEMNVLRVMRIAVGGRYRYCSNIHLNYENGGESILPQNILNGFSIGITIRFGKF